MSKQIILFVNPFHPDKNCLEYGIALATTFHQPLLLFSVINAPIPVYPGAELVSGVGNLKKLEETGRQKLEAVARSVKLRWAHTSYALESGFSPQSSMEKTHWLLKKAEERNAMLLIMGKEHDYLWWSQVTGTTETQVAEEAPCPVLIIPPEVTYRGFRQIFYLLDEEELYAEQLPNLQWVTNFGRQFQSALSIFIVPEEKELPEKELNQAMARIKALAPYPHCVYEQLMPHTEAEEIMHLAEVGPSDLLAFPYREKSFFQRLFGDENSRALILKATLPTLVF